MSRHRFLHIIVWTILTLLPSLLTHAQEYGLPSEWSVQHLNSVMVDHRGTLWIAAENGLLRPLPDGTVRRYTQVCTELTSCIMEGDNDTLWIGCTYGLVAFAPRTGHSHLFRTEHNSVNVSVAGITFLGSDRRKLLLATKGFGFRVWSIDDECEDLQIANQLNGLLSMGEYNMKHLHLDSLNRAWIISELGVTVIDINLCKRIELPHHLLKDVVAIAEDSRNGVMYLAGPNAGLLQCDLTTMQVSQIVTNGLSISSLFLDSNGDLLLGTDCQGLYVFSPKSGNIREVHTPADFTNLSRWKIHHIATTPQGDVCLGLYQHGLIILPHQSDGFTMCQLGIGSVTGLAINGTTIIAGADGIGVKVADELYTTINSALGSNSIQAVEVADSNDVYVGTYYGGLYRLHGRKIQPIDKSINVMGLKYDSRKKILYVATNGNGVFAYDTQVGTMKHVDGKYSAWTTSVAVTQNDVLWIGQQKEISRLNLNTHECTRIGTANNNRLRVNQIAVHGDSVWVASTLGLLYASATDSVLQKWPGCDEEVLSVIIDHDIRVWFTTFTSIWRCTNNGTVAYHPQAMLNGLGHFTIETSAQMSDGSIAFGCEEGIIKFHPNNVIANKAKWKLEPMFSRLFISGREVDFCADSTSNPIDAPLDFTTRLTLAHNEASFALIISPYSLCGSSNVCMEYRLKGYDSTWNRVTRASTHTALYSTLSPGQYTFTARIVDPDNSDVLGERTMIVVVTPPWYGLWWVRLIFILIALTLSALTAREYIQRRRRYEKILRIRALLLDLRRMDEEAKHNTTAAPAQQFPLLSLYDTDVDIDNTRPIEEYSSIDNEDKKLMTRITTVIKQNIDNTDFTVEMLASEVGLSRVHLNRRLKSIINMSPSDMIRTLRLREAAYLLTHTDLTVTQTTYMVGFSTPSHFNHCFTSHYGMTPKTFATNYARQQNHDYTAFIEKDN